MSSLSSSKLRNLPTVETTEPYKMLGAILPGDSTVEIKEFDVPKPEWGQVLVETKASTICGSDIRCIFRQYIGHGQEAYQVSIVDMEQV